MSPSITCLCILKPGREAMALRAIRGFASQTYRNIVLLLAGAPDAVNELSAQARRMAVSRNISSDRIDGFNLPAGVTSVTEIWARLSKAIRTDLLCMMDDDDVSHPDRLTRQIAAMAVASDKPVFLSGALYHFLPVNELFLVEREERFLPLPSRAILHSFVASVEKLPKIIKVTDRNIGANLGRAMIEACGRSGPTRICHESWWLKIGVHDDNRQGYDHFVELVHNPARSPAAGDLEARQCYLQRFLGDYDWDTAQTRVCGHNGLAFLYNNRSARDFPALVFKNIDIQEETV